MYIFQKGRIQPRDTLFASNVCGVSFKTTGTYVLWIFHYALFW